MLYCYGFSPQLFRAAIEGRVEDVERLVLGVGIVVTNQVSVYMYMYMYVYVCVVINVCVSVCMCLCVRINPGKLLCQVLSHFAVRRHPTTCSFPVWPS